MRQKVPVVGVMLLIGCSFLLFRLFQREVSQVWFGLATHPRVREILKEAGDDLKHLAVLDPAGAMRYHERFSEVQEVRQNLAILAQSRQNLTGRYEWMLLIGFGMVTGGWLLAFLWDQRRVARRLNGLHEPLAELARGQDRVRVPDRGKDVIGQIGLMIERTAAVIAGQRERLAYLAHLAEWQEAARLIAHEIRTPLSTMSLELMRLRDQTAAGEDPGTRLEPALASVMEEIERLKKFASGFTTIAGIGAPEPHPVDLAAFLQHFGSLFAKAWPGLELEVHIGGPLPLVAIDKAMVRQVLMNLCNNSAQAMSVDRKGWVRIQAEKGDPGVVVVVEDNGPGIPDALRSRVFEPYVSSRKANRGHGLGLAISRKIMLEHGGDLSLAETSSEGTRWCLSFPGLAHLVESGEDRDSGPVEVPKGGET